MSTEQNNMLGGEERSKRATFISPAFCAAPATTLSTCALKAGERSSCSGIAPRAAMTCWRFTARARLCHRWPSLQPSRT